MNPHILLVDDDPTIRELVAAHLEKRGYKVSLTANAAEALRVAEEVPLQLAVLDIDLGEGDGLELLGSLKTSQPDLPVVMMTGMGFDEDLLQEARRRKADGYVSKNLPVDQLFMEIVRALKHRKPASP
jgi:two-component system phosphate regulon response regulator OmpR